MDPGGSSQTGLWAKVCSDPSAKSLVLANLFTIFFAMVEDWSLLTVMWVYWSQSVIIGFFTVIKILSFKVPPEKLNENDLGRKAPLLAKIFLAGFFTFHYGFFHFGYASFLEVFSQMSNSPVESHYVFLTTCVFFANHLYSFLYNRTKETSKMNAGIIFMAPYARIIPMHLTIIFGGFIMMVGGSNRIILLLFLLLKTLADVLMHENKYMSAES